MVSLAGTFAVVSLEADPEADPEAEADDPDDDPEDPAEDPDPVTIMSAHVA